MSEYLDAVLGDSGVGERRRYGHIPDSSIPAPREFSAEVMDGVPDTKMEQS